MDENETEDEVLMVQIAQGDKLAFSRFLDRHLAAAVNFAMGYIKHPADAEDITQEAFTRVWTKASSWQDVGASPKAWLYRITYHLCIDEIRRRKPIDSADEVELIADSKSKPDAALLRKQDSAQLATALDALPERQRTAIVLCALRGFSNKDAALTMDSSVDALESLLSRGRRRLRELMLDPNGVNVS
ncbi:MAG TPA: sigma-70 family RNA polymerase sigma factor [Acidiferrobacteraceae bacterium]|nr:sigma-70 family RNA polymerase sigma factor [Acidiferrobacteraceae bacterium]